MPSLQLLDPTLLAELEDAGDTVSGPLLVKLKSSCIAAQQQVGVLAVRWLRQQQELDEQKHSSCQALDGSTCNSADAVQPAVVQTLPSEPAAGSDCAGPGLGSGGATAQAGSAPHGGMPKPSKLRAKRSMRKSPLCSVTDTCDALTHPSTQHRQRNTSSAARESAQQKHELQKQGEQTDARLLNTMQGAAVWQQPELEALRNKVVDLQAQLQHARSRIQQTDERASTTDAALHESRKEKSGVELKVQQLEEQLKVSQVRTLASQAA